MVKEKVGEYMDYASIHGIGRMKNSPFIFLKILWIVALVASLAVIAWQVSELYSKYKSYPISTSIEVTTAQKLYFPGVTICNTNPVMNSAIQNSSQLLEVVNEGYDEYFIDADAFKASDVNDYNYTVSDNLASSKPLDQNILWYIKEQFKMRLSVVDNDDLKELTQHIHDFILLCNFAGTNCSGTVMNTIRSYDYGLCYYFDPSKHSALEPGGKIAAAGRRYALELLLNVEQSDFVPFVTSSPGVAIGIHHPEENITFFDVDESIFVPTGFEASISLTQQCKRDCFYKYILTKCKCYMNFFEHAYINITDVPLDEIVDDQGIAPCHTDEHYTCIQNIQIQNIKLTPEVCLQCLPPCFETYFEKDVAISTWPSENFLPIIRRILTKQYSQWDGSQREDYVRNNLALVRIYLKSLTFQTMTEEYSYSVRK
ncbi:Amiloride-sensitive sodium channel subunit [Mactra antiquata]